jgi:hypothetical protein
MVKRRSADALAVWLVGAPAAIAVVAIAVTFPLTSRYDKGVCWDIAWTTSALTALAGVAVARRHARGVHRLRWTLWTAAAACWLGGQIAWDAFELLGFPASPNLADVGWWAFAIIVGVSVVCCSGLSRSLRIVAVVETVPLIAAAMALTFAELWHYASVSTLALAPLISALVYPALYVWAAVLTIQSMIG